jgi:hypothetical protein
MDEKNPFLNSLPSSATPNSGPQPVSNFSLMPTANKLPGKAATSPKGTPAPEPHLLGSGNKIPQSLDSRMASQFAVPDPAVYQPKRRVEAPEQQGSWVTSEVRNSIPYSAYKTTTSTSSGKEAAPKAREALAKEAALQKAKTASEHKRLIGQKEAFLHNLCTTPGITSHSPEIKRISGMVGEINQKLGLPFNHTGGWKLPSD